MGYAKPYYISPAFAFTSYPNRDSTPFKEFYNIPEAETVIRGTLRYQGFPEFIKALVQLGWLDASEKVWLKEGLTWAQVMQKTLNTNDANERYVLFFCSICGRSSYELPVFQYFDRPHRGAL
jgi:saccharopine dehydrogenase-like NADP-dependent oxidoreductase